jgi:methyltransferase (TIGR00027 family)
METDRSSRTALAAAFYRAQHHRHDDPKILDDPYAHRLLGADEMAAFTARCIADGREAGFRGEPDAILARALRVLTPASSVLVRARYAEDRLAAAIARGVRQYVIVGAGLDSFAFRRRDLADRLDVFEIDHPRSQADKRVRLAAAGLAEPPNLRFGAVDFERERVGDALRRLAFRAAEPAVFAWLGVTMYLTRAAIDGTWRALRAVAAGGSELVFDFLRARPASEPVPAGAQRVLDRARAAGEPMIGALDPATLEAELSAAGWSLVERLDGAELDRRYFADRSDGWRARPSANLVCAVA